MHNPIYSPIFSAPPNEQQLPIPVSVEKKQSAPTLNDPCPCTIAASHQHQENLLVRRIHTQMDWIVAQKQAGCADQDRKTRPLAVDQNPTRNTYIAS